MTVTQEIGSEVDFGLCLFVKETNFQHDNYVYVLWDNGTTIG